MARMLLKPTSEWLLAPALRTASAFKLLLFLVLAVVSGAVGCTSGSQPAAGSDRLVVGIEGNPTNLDPRQSTDAASSRILELVVPGLVRLDASGMPVPDLAVSWDHPEPAVHIFHLREGVRFQDGSVFGARDVVATFDTLLDPAYPSPHKGAYSILARVEALDERTVRFTLKEPFAPFLVSLDRGILPAAFARARNPDGTYASVAPGRPPIGAGPFRVSEWVSGAWVVLDRFDGAWGERPELAGVVFKVIPDGTVRLLELEKGSVQLVENEIEADALPRLERNPRLAIVKAPGTTFAYIGFNLEDPILSHRGVREAIAHAIDRDAIIRHLMGGLATPATGILPPSSWAYEPEVETYGYDPALARKLLDEAGHRDPDGDGPAPRFRVTYKTTPARRRMAEAIQAELAAVGVGVEIQAAEWGAFFDDVKRGNFQMYSLEWVGVNDPDVFHMIFHSTSVPPAGANRNRYRSPEVDALIDEGRRLEDRPARRAVYSRIQKIVAHDLPYVPLWTKTNFAVMSRRVQGFELHPSGDFLSLVPTRLLPAVP